MSEDQKRDKDGIRIDPDYTPHRIPEHSLRYGVAKNNAGNGASKSKKECLKTSR